MKPAITLAWLNFENRYAQAYAEVIRSLHWGFTDLGFNCVVATEPQTGRVNIVFGWELGLENLLQFPSDSIFYHLDQHGDSFDGNLAAIEIAEKFKVWDFSKKAIPKWGQLNSRCQPYYAPICYAPVLSDLDKRQQDIDIGYIGKFVEPRLRQMTLIAESKEKSVACLSGVWGALRNEFISRTKVLVNVSAQASYCSTLEMVRLQYFLANKKAVVCERYPIDLEVPTYLENVLRLVPEVDLHSTIQELLENDTLRIGYEQDCFNAFAAQDVRKVIQGYF